MRKTCPICGNHFDAPPSGRSTCSKGCERVLRSKSHLGVSNTWSDEARSRLSQRGKTDNLAMGTPAARASPLAGRGPENVSAKDWTLVSPDGMVYEIHNLNDWVRYNTDLFGEDTGDDAAAARIANGFRVLKRSRDGKLQDGQRGASSYKGWNIR